MKKIINYLKRLIGKATSRPKLREVYTINIKYCANEEVRKFLKERRTLCLENGVDFELDYKEGHESLVGIVELFRGKVFIHKAKLKMNEANLIYWQFYE